MSMYKVYCRTVPVGYTSLWIFPFIPPGSRTLHEVLPAKCITAMYITWP